MNIKIVVVTDVHSWIGGHGPHEQQTQQQPQQRVDYGTVLSLVQRLRQQSAQQQQDDKDGEAVFFLNNGDFMDGTGLSTVPPTYLLPLLEQMPFDAINVGNHELLHNETVEYMRQSGFIHHWNGTYLSSNTFDATTGEPLGSLYTYLTASSSSNDNVRLLTFGFLFNFQNHCSVVTVQNVQDTVQEEWFRNVLQQTDQYDAIVVLAHMDCQDPLVTNELLPSIRSVVGLDTVIVFLTGHTHRRCFVQLDDAAISLEAGRFLDTIGIVQFRIDSDRRRRPIVFQHEFVNATRHDLQRVLGDPYTMPLDTSAGIALSTEIQATRTALGLPQVLGCAPQHYYLNQGIGMDNDHNHSSSLWRFYLDHVVPVTIADHNDDDDKLRRRVFVQSTGGLRYDLFEGQTTLDDLIAVSPYNDTVVQICTGLQGSELDALLNLLNDEGFSVVPSLPPFLSTADLSSSSSFPGRTMLLRGGDAHRPRFDLLGIDFDVTKVVSTAHRIHPDLECHPVPFCKARDGQQQPPRSDCRVTSLDLWIDYVTQDTTCTSCTPTHCIHRSNTSASAAAAATTSSQSITKRGLLPTENISTLSASFPVLIIAYAASHYYARLRKLRTKRNTTTPPLISHSATGMIPTYDSINQADVFVSCN